MNLRDKYKGSKMATLTATRKEAEKVEPQRGNSFNRTFHTIEEGTNIFRIAPAPSEDIPPFLACRTTMMDCECDVYDSDGNASGKKEIKRKKIFISTVHGTTEEQKKQDIIEEYIKFLNKQAWDLYPNKEDKDERTKYLSALRGWRGKDGKWNWGIEPRTNFICYAWRDGELGRLEIEDKILKKIEAINSEESESGEIVFDIFSSLDNAYNLKIRLDIDDKKKRDYTITKEEMSKKDKSWADYFKRTNLTDEMLEELDAQKPLCELYIDCYTRKDYELALDALQRFDSKNKYDIFDNDEFLDIVTYIGELYLEDEKGETKPSTTKTTQPKQTPPTTTKKETVKEKEVEELPAVDFSKKTPVWMKKYIMAFVNDNYEADEAENFEMPADTKELIALCELVANEEMLPEEYFTPDMNLDNSNDSEVDTDTDDDAAQEAALQANIAKMKARRAK